MRLSLQKAAHAAVEWIRVQEIRVKLCLSLAAANGGVHPGGVNVPHSSQKKA
jgi:hypothetical protein